MPTLSDLELSPDFVSTCSTLDLENSVKDIQLVVQKTLALVESMSAALISSGIPAMGLGQAPGLSRDISCERSVVVSRHLSEQSAAKNLAGFPAFGSSSSSLGVSQGTPSSAAVRRRKSKTAFCPSVSHRLSSEAIEKKPGESLEEKPEGKTQGSVNFENFIASGSCSPPCDAAPSAEQHRLHAAGNFIERVVQSNRFEMFFTLFIVLNAVNMCVEAEFRGWGRGYTLGIHGSAALSATSEKAFAAIEVVFVVTFTIEVLLKILVLRCRFWKCTWNRFDLFIVFSAWVDVYLSIDFPLNPTLCRLLRLCRLIRLLKGSGKMQLFETVNLMVRGIQASVPVLLWVVALVLPILVSCALFVLYTVQEFLDDESKLEKDRLDCYRYFGTFSNALVSMFEVTFANFTPILRLLYDNVDGKFALFIMTYKMVIGLACLRIIYGVFLHVTLSCARADDEEVIAQKEREIKKYELKMEAFFKQHDDFGLGFLTQDQFVALVSNRHVKSWLSGYMELEIFDEEMLFALIDLKGEGKVMIDDVVSGFARLKGPARSVDVLALAEHTQAVLGKLDDIIENLDKACEA